MMADHDIIKSLIDIVPPVFTTAATIILPIILFKQNNQGRKIDKQEEKLESVKQTGEAIHVLGNSAKSSQLKLTATSERSRAAAMLVIAELRNKAPGDMAAADAASKAADEAERLWHEHEIKQAVVDEKSAVAKEPTK